MPRRKKAFLDIPLLYQRQCLDHIMFGYVNGIKKAMPSVGIAECIQYFMEDNGLEEEDFPLETACTTYWRMMKEYYESQRSKYKKD